MRENRQSGSEGGGGGVSPYPYRRGTLPVVMAGTSPAMTFERSAAFYETGPEADVPLVEVEPAMVSVGRLAAETA